MEDYSTVFTMTNLVGIYFTTSNRNPRSRLDLSKDEDDTIVCKTDEE